MHVVLLPLVAALLAVPVVVAQASDQANRSEVAPRSGVSSQTPASEPVLTLDQAITLAEAANPELRRTLALRSSVEGNAADANTILWNNPELSAERTRRAVPQAPGITETQREWSADLSQTLEIAGQQGHRRRAAHQELDALNASIEDARLLLRGEVERQFVQVVALQERLATERLAVSIIEETSLSVQKRVAAGEDSRLDGNLANIEAVRARNQVGALEEQLLEARRELAATLQLPPGSLPAAAGALTAARPVASLETLLDRAARRPALRALGHREQAAKQRLQLERSARYPDITVGLATAREGVGPSRERVTTLSMSVPLPLFRRNAGGIGRAVTELTQAEIDRQAADRNGLADVTVLWQKQQSLQRRVAALQTTILPVLEENQRLSMTSLRAGEISLVQLLLVNRQMLDGRRDLIDTQTELRMATIALALASDWPHGEAAP